ncbi:caspase-8-like protein, partial [Leptotrombidium deliense]
LRRVKATSREMEVITHVFGTEYIESFMRNTDVIICYIQEEEDDTFYEINEIKNRCSDNIKGETGICISFGFFATKYDKGIQYPRDRSITIKDSFGYELMSLTDMIAIINSHIVNWNTEEVFILELSLAGVYESGIFKLFIQETIIDLKLFLRELIVQNPLLEYVPKMIFVDILLNEEQFEYIDFTETKRSEKLDSVVKTESKYDYLKNTSDMLIIWSTIRNYANILSVNIGSFLSFMISHYLKVSHSVEINLQYHLNVLRMYSYQQPFELNNINLQKAVVFGQDDETKGVYNLTSSTNGLCIIIRNEKFPEHMRQKYVTDKTVKNYKDGFERHGFKCRTFNDLSALEMWEQLSIVSKDKVLESHNALVIILISNTDTFENVDVIYGNDGNYFTMNNLKMLFNDKSCTALKGKLKLFIIDGPRGGNFIQLIYRNFIL